MSTSPKNSAPSRDKHTDVRGLKKIPTRAAGAGTNCFPCSILIWLGILGVLILLVVAIVPAVLHSISQDGKNSFASFRVLQYLKLLGSTSTRKTTR